MNGRADDGTRARSHSSEPGDPADGPFPPPCKHSLTLHGHRTSVSLEAPFWAAFQAAATRRGLSVNALAARVDAARGTEASLASAIRLFVLAEVTGSA